MQLWRGSVRIIAIRQEAQRLSSLFGPIRSRRAAVGRSLTAPEASLRCPPPRTDWALRC
ncbi:hypothetical protein BD309DRAFT_948573 [Dichomitus squalens]|nr:hypothetical protein BD309DRAFT_948573 [Dichomitus squalens]